MAEAIMQFRLFLTLPEDDPIRSEDSPTGARTVREEYRIVDLEDAYTIGLLLYDPLGNAASISFDPIESPTIRKLKEIMGLMSEAIDKPVISIRCVR